MIIVGKLFKKEARLTRKDAVFGLIALGPIHGVDMWCHIPSEEEDHGLSIFAPASGPTQKQQDFYSQPRRNLPAREAEAKAFVATQACASANLSAMTVYSVGIGDDNQLASGQFAIELSDGTANKIYVVEFKNGKPENCGVEVRRTMNQERGTDPCAT